MKTKEQLRDLVITKAVSRFLLDEDPLKAYEALKKFTDEGRGEEIAFGMVYCGDECDFEIVPADGLETREVGQILELIENAILDINSILVDFSDCDIVGYCEDVKRQLEIKPILLGNLKTIEGNSVHS